MGIITYRTRVTTHPSLPGTIHIHTLGLSVRIGFFLKSIVVCLRTQRLLLARVNAWPESNHKEKPGKLKIRNILFIKIEEDDILLKC